MIRICGERVSARLSRRLCVETTGISLYEKSTLCSKWMDRAHKIIQKVLFSFPPKSTCSLVLTPSFPIEKCAEVSDRASAVRQNYENVVLWIGAIFSLFVSIFYQSSEEPPSYQNICGHIRGEREEVYASFLSSLSFLGLYQEVVHCLQYRIFVMEKSYV